MKTRRFRYQVVLCGLIFFNIFLSSACSTATTALPSPTLEPVTPTITPSPESTLSPSPSPTPMLNAQDLYGTWTVWDPDARGPNFITFNEDGTFTTSHGINQGQLLHEGTYTLDGNKLTFLDWWYCEPDQQVGTYMIRMGPGNKSIRFFPVDDPCEERAYDFTNRIIKWDRFVPAPTSSP